MDISQVEQHIKRPASVAGTGGAAAGPTLCQQVEQEHLVYVVLGVGEMLPRLPRLRTWCWHCILIHALGGSPVASKFHKRAGHNSKLRVFFTEIKSGVLKDESGRFMAEDINGNHKFRITDLKLNKVIGSPHGISAAASMVRGYLAWEVSRTEEQHRRNNQLDAQQSGGQTRKGQEHDRSQRGSKPFNPPRIVEAAPEPERAMEPRETLFAAAEPAPTPSAEPEGVKGVLTRQAEDSAATSPAKLMELPRLHQARLNLRAVLATVMQEADGDGIFRVSMRALALKAGLTRENAQRQVRELLEGGVVTVLQQGGKGALGATTYGFASDPYDLLERLPSQEGMPAPPLVTGQWASVPEGAQPPNPDPVLNGQTRPAAPHVAAAVGASSSTRVVWENAALAPPEDSPSAAVLAGQALVRLDALEAQEDLRGVLSSLQDEVLTLIERTESHIEAINTLRADQNLLTEWLERTFKVSLKRGRQP